MIFEELIKIEEQITKVNLKDNNKNYYNFVKSYNSEITEIFNDLINKKSEIIKFLRYELEYIKKINLKFDKIIKNEFDYTMLLLSIFLLKTFTDTKNFASKSDIRLSEKTFNNAFESYSIINFIENDFKSFFV